MKKLLVGVSALAIGLVASSGAWANPKNTFSNGNTQTVISLAIAGGAAFSESFNVNQEAVSVQTLNGASTGGSLSVATTIRRKRRAPADTAAATAVRSAQMPRP